MSKKITHAEGSNTKDVIWIGGAPYKRKAVYKGWYCSIVGYDINTERHLIVKNTFGKEERIELDNDQLILTGI